MAEDGRPSDEFVKKILGYPDELKLEVILSLGLPEKSVASCESDDVFFAKVHHESFTFD